MELTRDAHLEPAKIHLADRTDYAPIEVFAAMLALEDPSDVEASLVDSKRGEDGTTWRAVWLSGDRLTYCEATRDDHADWTLDLTQVAGQAEPKIEAWSTPVSAVAALSVLAARAGRAGIGTAEADIVWSVELSGGRDFRVPLFGQFAHHYDADRCEAFVAALRAAHGGAGAATT